jgi:hypothetical protein
LTTPTSPIALATDTPLPQDGPDPAVVDINTNTAATPLYRLPLSSWFLQRQTGCDLAPPPAGEALRLPAGGEFMTQLASNRAFTTLGRGPVTEWPDGGANRTLPWRAARGRGCLVDEDDGGGGGAMHARGWESAAGTAWAISYKDRIEDVGVADLVVFSVRYQWVTLGRGGAREVVGC